MENSEIENWGNNKKNELEEKKNNKNIESNWSIYMLQ